MLIKNNTTDELIISGMLRDGTNIILAASATTDIDVSLLVTDAATKILDIFGAHVTVTSVDSNIGKSTIIPLVDTVNTLTAAQLVSGAVFTAVPTAARIQTTDTAAAIIAAIPNYAVGSSFEFTIVNTAAFNETLNPGVGVTIVGSAVVNNASATFKAVVTSSTLVSIFRK